jgi:hypothetical protein
MIGTAASVPAIRPPARSSAAHGHAFISIPAGAQTVSIPLAFNERFGDLISRILTTARMPEHPAGYHLYGLDNNFRQFKDEDSTAVLFQQPYRSLILQVGTPRRINVHFEGRCAIIDHLEETLLCDLIAIAVQCFNLTLTEGEALLALDPTTTDVLPVDTPVTPSLIILKRFNLFLSDVVFTATAEHDAAQFRIIFLSKKIIADPMKSLLTGARARREQPLEFAALSEDRIRTFFSAFQSSPDISGIATVAEQNSLLFLLFGASGRPLLSEAMHDRALGIMREKSDLKKYIELQVFTVYLSIETHCILNEICQLFAGICQSNRSTVINLLAKMLFPASKEEKTEKEFVSFLLMCGPFLFRFPARPGRKLVSVGDRLVFVDGPAAITFEGTFDLGKAAGAKDFRVDTSVPELVKALGQAARERVAAPEQAASVKELNQELLEAMWLLVKYEGSAIDASSVIDLPFDQVFAPP